VAFADALDVRERPPGPLPGSLVRRRLFARHTRSGGGDDGLWVRALAAGNARGAPRHVPKVRACAMLSCVSKAGLERLQRLLLYRRVDEKNRKIAKRK